MLQSWQLECLVVFGWISCQKMIFKVTRMYLWLFTIAIIWLTYHLMQVYTCCLTNSYQFVRYSATVLLAVFILKYNSRFLKCNRTDHTAWKSKMLLPPSLRNLHHYIMHTWKYFHLWACCLIYEWVIPLLAITGLQIWIKLLTASIPNLDEFVIN